MLMTFALAAKDPKVLITGLLQHKKFNVGIKNYRCLIGILQRSISLGMDITTAVMKRSGIKSHIFVGT